MKKLEDVYNKLNELLIEKLPDYIEKVNKENNDGLIIEPFENKNLEDTCSNLPCFAFDLQEAEATEKDRIIETKQIIFTLDIKLKPNTKKKLIKYFRSKYAVYKILEEADTELWNGYKTIPGKLNQIKIEITI